MTRDAVIAEAKTWLNTPYHHQGCVKGAGVDCAMLLVAVYHAVGLIPPIDPRPYPHDWHLHRTAERYLAWLEQYARPVDTPQAGDVAVWRFGRTFSHGAICLDGTQIIHAYIGLGCILDDRGNSALSDRPVQFFSLF
ncbi:MAG: NlpC/P60 family protein [Neisseria sp.]|nr:NlpC/P60 family protein [Neisseria sp.]